MSTIDLRVTGHRSDSYDVELRMQDGSVQRLRIPRGWMEEAHGHFVTNLDLTHEDRPAKAAAATVRGSEHDMSELPTQMYHEPDDAFVDEGPTLLDRARGRRHEALVARVLEWRKKR